MSVQSTSLKPGMPIVTLDGDQIGLIKETRPGFFKVDAPRRRDYWLPAEYLGEVNDTAKLILPTGAVRAYKLRKPEMPEKTAAAGGALGGRDDIDRDIMLGR